MEIVDRALYSMVSKVQMVFSHMHGYEDRYLREYHPHAIEASASAPRREEEPFDLKLSEVAADMRANRGGKPYLDLDRMLDDGMGTMSAIIKMTRGVRKSFRSLRENEGLGKTRAGSAFYTELKRNARDYGIDLMGFTPVSVDHIFRGKRILFPNAIVCVQEMKRADMETAPDLGASVETLRVYANLGHAMNRLADFIRAQGIPCQVGHPLMGLVLYPALAAGAGMGCLARQGLLITPEFGPRQRIGAIFVPLEDMPWTGGEQHSWVLDFCDRCNLCVKRCPGGAIYTEPHPNTPSVFTTIDNAACAPWFSLYLGCSVCIKVCPFSRKSYDHIKQAYERNEAAQVIEE
jgi:ferredoxin